MLWSRIIRRFREIPPASNAAVKRRGARRSQTKQCLEGGQILLAGLLTGKLTLKATQVCGKGWAGTPLHYIW